MKYAGDPKFSKLIEREKELKCLYSVYELLKDSNSNLDKIFSGLVDVVPMGWQHTTLCNAYIVYEGQEFYNDDFIRTSWYQKADIIVDEHYCGEVRVYYSQNIYHEEYPFLQEEQKLLHTITEMLSQFIFKKKLIESQDYLRKLQNYGQVDGPSEFLTAEANQHWKWRLEIIRKIADLTDLEAFGIEGLYLIGSTKRAEAGPASDIDIIVHMIDDAHKIELAKAWFRGWGMALAEMNFQKTGYAVKESLIDLHIVNDESFPKGDSFAVMIGAREDAAHPLKVKS